MLRRINPGARALLLLILVGVCAGLAGAPAVRQAAQRLVKQDTALADPRDPGPLALVREIALPLTGATQDYDPLMELIGDAQFVLLGEASHGTHEFYRERAEITRRLIEEKGFSAVAIEGDRANTDRVNRYIHRSSADSSAEQALADFDDFPEWMWRNADVRNLVEWLRDYNAGLPANARRVGFYGLDLYGLFESADAVVHHLERLDPAAAERARRRYRCFAEFRNDPAAYGGASASRSGSSCAEPAREQLEELQQRATESGLYLDPARKDDFFAAVEHARVVQNGEEYFRTAYGGGGSSWNLRDQHMVEMLEALAAHYGAGGKPGKVVAWAHNTHMGDASATELGESGEWNVGQLMRERHADRVVLVGFTTYTGTVMAAANWGMPGELKDVRPALPDSYSGLFHETGIGDFLLPLRGRAELAEALGEPRLERAIGVIYRPETERASHYFHARLSRQFDAVIHLDVTRAVEPLGP